MKKEENATKNVEGLSVKKEEDISEWYSQVVQKAELCDYAPIRGFMVIRPNAYFVWEKIQEYFNKVLEKKGVSNAYFPLLIPESFFKKEAEHAEKFSPELAFIEGKEEGERLALRPTSETIIYNSFSKWIRSWRDLPLKVNQWCNILRWEVKQTKLLIRTREFLWQEGHCAFEKEEEALEDIREMACEYKKMIEELLAIPVLVGRKSEMEKFGGAEITMALEALMPDGKALQMGTTHFLKKDFAYSFGVRYLDREEKIKSPFTTSWGISTRLIGALVMLHGDNKGLILPPKIAKYQIVIVPIYNSKNKEKVFEKVKEVKHSLSGHRIFVDDRESYSPGWKFNEWELKGVPLRIEIGEKDIEKRQVTFVRRDSGKKESVSEKKIAENAREILDDIQRSLLEKAKKFLESSIDEAKNLKELQKKIEEKKIVKVYMVNEPAVEEKISETIGGATSRFVETSEKEGVCVYSGKKTKTIAYFAKSY